MQGMAQVSLVVDLILGILLIFLWWIQRRDRHALYWGLGHLSMLLMILLWYHPQILPWSSFWRHEALALLAFGGWTGYWFGSKWAIGDDARHWQRDLWVLIGLAVLMRAAVLLGDPFQSLISVSALIHYALMTGVFCCSGYWFWQRLPEYRLLALILYGRAVLTLLMPLAMEWQWYAAQIFLVASVLKIGCLFGFFYLVLDQARQRYRVTIDSLSHGFMIRDKAGVIKIANQRGARLLGFSSREQLQGLNVRQVLPRLSQQAADDYFLRLSAPGAEPPFVDEAELTLHNGQKLQAELISSPYFERGQLYCLVQLLDISARKQQQAELNKIAATDRLTGLLNRNAFASQLDQQLAHGPLALLIFDLDHFNRINNNFGPQFGDLLLSAVAERLTQQQATLAGTVAARLGSDEFALLVPLSASAHLSTALLSQSVTALLQMFIQPFELQGQSLQLSVSIGSSQSPGDGQSSDVLLKHTEIAVYNAKLEGRQRWVQFLPPMLEPARQFLLIDSELKQAIGRGQLSLVYQPIYRTAEPAVDELLGLMPQHDTATMSRPKAQAPAFYNMEALLRWHHHELGHVSPDRFISVAEESGFIVTLGAWVLQQACAQLALWQQTQSSLLLLSVNVSASQLSQAGFCAELAELLQQYQLQPQQLELEITERVLLADNQHVREVLSTLLELGVRLSLDDFGTGYSSLSYLSRFVLHTLKIDRAFVQRMSENQRSADLVKAIVAMGQSLQLQLVAEGVETMQQATTLAELGCDYLQGYYFSRPQTAAQITAQLEAQANAAG